MVLINGGDTCNIFEIIALESFLGAEMTFEGHSMSSEMAQFERKHTTPINLRTKYDPVFLPFPRYSEFLVENCELFPPNRY